MKITVNGLAQKKYYPEDEFRDKSDEYGAELPKFWTWQAAFCHGFMQKGLFHSAGNCVPVVIICYTIC